MAVGDRFVLDENEGKAINRIDQKDNWKAANPVLGLGEIGIEKQGLQRAVKIGDGVTPWNELLYAFQSCPYEVGDIFMTTSSTDPAVRWPGTKWEAFAPGRVLIGAGTGTDSRGESKTFAVGDTGGEYQHQLTTGELPSHKHTIKCGYGDIGSPTVNDDAFRYQFWGGSNRGWHDWLMAATGSNQPHNLLQPYQICYYFKRIS